MDRRRFAPDMAAPDEVKEKEVRELTTPEATKLLHGFFGFSHGSNGVLRYGEVMYRNSHGQHKLPEGFANPDSPAPQAIANYAGNTSKHPRVIREVSGRPFPSTPEQILGVAVEEAGFFQRVMESPHELNAYDVWRGMSRTDWYKPIFAEPELEVIRMMMIEDMANIERGRDPKFLPILRSPSLVQKMQFVHGLFSELAPGVEKTLELQRAIVDDESADDMDREAAAGYLDLYRKVSATVDAIEKKKE